MRLVAIYGMYANDGQGVRRKHVKETREVVHIAQINTNVVAYVIAVDGKSIVPAHAIPDFLELSTAVQGDGR